MGVFVSPFFSLPPKYIASIAYAYHAQSLSVFLFLSSNERCCIKELVGCIVEP